MTRLRDLGEAHVLGEAGNAVAVRVSVALTEGDAHAEWSGRLRPYRPLALMPGRYVLRIRGEDVGVLRVQRLAAGREGEVAEFTGEGQPGDLLHYLVASTAPVRDRERRFPRVAGEVEPTALASTIGGVGALLRRVAAVPARAIGLALRPLKPRRRVGMAGTRRR